MSALAATAKPTTIVWLRDELRVHDNALLAEAAARGGPVLPVYVLDDRVFDAAATSESGGSRKCGAKRRKDEAAVAKVAPLAKVWEGTLYHPEDLRGVAFHDLFTAWRTKVEKAGTRVRGDVFPKAATLPAPPAGHVFEEDRLKDYYDTRNGMIGQGYSTKLAPWLSRGCVSPRAVARACAEYERTRGIKNKSTYWVVFELTWRDYFVFYAQKYGSKLFRPYGVKDIRERTWRADPEALRRWKAGETGAPLHFEEHLVDYTPEANWGNWHAAGLSGGRVNRFNILKQSKDYDPKGDYVKLWIPELAKGFKFPDGARPGKKSHQQDRKGKGGERAQIQRKRKQKSRVQASAWAE
ncbi:DNA photolyase [Aureococcus anophagefferens]|nr:DNA photolyase [Aureococcus anophagefferens]